MLERSEDKRMSKDEREERKNRIKQREMIQKR